MPFDSPRLLDTLKGMPAEQLDELPFGVIGFDAQGVVQRYNAHEAMMANFEVASVLGQHVFVELAPCLNNYLVAGRFEEAQEQGQALDEILPYVLSFRMRPTRVQMRLLSSPDEALRFILVQRQLSTAP
jgi:photoactive yellow protein